VTPERHPLTTGIQLQRPSLLLVSLLATAPATAQALVRTTAADSSRHQQSQNAALKSEQLADLAPFPSPQCAAAAPLLLLLLRGNKAELLRQLINGLLHILQLLHQCVGP